MRDLFQYVPGSSLIHRLNPITKLLITIVICAAAFITDSLVFLLVLLLLDLAIGFIAGVPGKTLGILKGLDNDGVLYYFMDLESYELV